MIKSGLSSYRDNTPIVNKQLEHEYHEIRLKEPLITKDLYAICKRNNTYLEGLDYSVKTMSSVNSKIERHEHNTGNVASSLRSICSDIIRYTQICKHEDIFKIAKETIDELEKQGYQLTIIRNYFKHPYPNTGYKGLHMNFVSPYGETFELQFHSEDSFKIKQQGHELYEKIRAVSTPIEEKEKLKKEILRIHNLVSNPPGYDELDNYIAPQDVLQQKHTNCEVNISTQFDLAKSINVLIYNIIMDEEEILKGYEITYHDKSKDIGRQLKGENLSQLSLTKNGTISSNIQTNIDLYSKPFDFPIEMANSKNTKHQIWISSNLKSKQPIMESTTREIKSTHSQLKQNKNRLQEAATSKKNSRDTI